MLRAPALATVLAAFALASCAPIPPPDILAELEQSRVAPAIVEATDLVPSAVHKAELLRAEANSALEQGDFSGAQILGERARAAYRLAVAVARIAKVQQSEVDAVAEAEAIEQELAALDAEQQQVAADVAALQLRAAALAGSGHEGSGSDAWTPADAAAATRALRIQARLLCTATRLLAPNAEAAGTPVPGDTASDAGTGLPALELRLRATDPPMALAEALALREGCLRQLTAVRRALQVSGTDAALSDELLEQLAEHAPGAVRRDERGVVVTLRRPFDGSGLGTSAAAALRLMGTVAREHPAFPVLVVVHSTTATAGGPKVKATGSVAGSPAERGSQVVRALGVPATVELAGDAQPLLPAGRYESRNDRVEVVFVSPALL